MKSRRDVISERKRAKVRVLSRAAAIPTLRQSQQLFATHRALGWSGGVAGVTFERLVLRISTRPVESRNRVRFGHDRRLCRAQNERRKRRREPMGAHRARPANARARARPAPWARKSRLRTRPGRMRRPGENLPGPGRGSFRRGLDSRKLARSQLPRWQARGRKSEASLRADPLARLRRAERPGRGAAPRPVISLSP